MPNLEVRDSMESIVKERPLPVLQLEPGLMESKNNLIVFQHARTGFKFVMDKYLSVRWLHTGR